MYRTHYILLLKRDGAKNLLTDCGKLEWWAPLAPEVTRYLTAKVVWLRNLHIVIQWILFSWFPAFSPDIHGSKRRKLQPKIDHKQIVKSSIKSSLEIRPYQNVKCFAKKIIFRCKPGRHPCLIVYVVSFVFLGGESQLKPRLKIPSYFQFPFIKTPLGLTASQIWHLSQLPL